MAEDDLTVPESLLPYDEWTQEALRQVVVSALRACRAKRAARRASFLYHVQDPAIPVWSIPDRLRAQYPEEMTIVLQHQYHSLSVDEGGSSLSVGLSFGGVPAILTIPIVAITNFADPEVRFGLHFEVTVPEPIKVADIPAPEGDDVPARPTDGPADVVSLDAFRRRQKEDSRES